MNLVIRSQRGYTLIGMMVIIVFLSLFLMAGIGVYQQNVQANKINKTALQIGQWLEAAKSFYINEGYWPVRAYGPETLGELINKGYMPPCTNGKRFCVTTNPWGTPYEGKTVSRETPDGQRQSIFGIVTTLPSESIAQAIGQRLPNIEYLSSNKKTIRLGA